MVIGLIGAGLVVLGLIAVVVGVVPPSDAVDLGGRTAPVLAFVVAIAIVAALAAEAGVFRAVANAAARVARGRAAVLWAMVVAIAVVSTIFLSLDTTAVLLTPIVIAIAARAGLPTIPFAMTTVWLANCASLLLPVSNLTNLLAATSPVLQHTDYLQLSALPALVAIVVPVAILGIVYRRDLAMSYSLHPAVEPVDTTLRLIAAVVVLLLIPLLVSGIPVWIPAAGAALVLVAAFAFRARSTLTWRLIPWSIVLFVCGLFLTVTAAGRLGLTALLTAAAGTGAAPLDLLRLAGVGTISGNIADNLPAYLALEPVAHSPARLITLLIAVNAGPLITPWASLATLLWHSRLAADGVRISWLRFAGLGLVAAPITVAAAVLAVPLLG